MDAIRFAIVAEARDWIGTRWQHQQACKGVGCDCVGLIAGVARELGFDGAVRFRRDPRFRGYSRTPDDALLRTATAEYLDQVDAAQPGDILVLRHERSPRTPHFAILSADDYMVHAYAQARAVVENRIDDVWRRRIVAAFKYREAA